MNIAVTGATGHIGNNLVKSLVNKNHNIKVLLRKDTSLFNNMKIEKVYGDILDKRAVNELVADIDVVIHLASKIFINGRNKNKYYLQNVEGTKNIVNSMKEQKIQKLIYFSSIHAYDCKPYNQTMDETRPLLLKSKYLYSRSKAVSQQIVIDEGKRSMQTLVLNPTAVIGPNDNKPSLLGQAILKMASGKLPALITGGYNMVDVRDVVDATLHALDLNKSGESYILPGSWVSLTELYNYIKMNSGIQKKLIIIPELLARIGVPLIKTASLIMNKEPIYTQESISILKNNNQDISDEKAKKDLNFYSRPFEETIRDTINWFKVNNYIN